MSAAHTPGPWTVGGKYTHKTVLLNARGESIASGGNNRAVQGEELEASLILAAAAPEMLEALRRVQRNTAGYDPMSTMGLLHEIASAAIAKATGGAE